MQYKLYVLLTWSILFHFGMSKLLVVAPGCKMTGYSEWNERPIL